MRLPEFIFKIFKSLLPGFVALYFLVIFPFNIFLDRDLQYNGKTVIGNVTESKMLKGKNGKPYRTVKVEYFSVDTNKKYSKWFNNEKIDVGKTVEINYSPISPGHSILLKDKSSKYPWNQNIFFRIIIFSFIGSIFCSVAISFFRS